MVIAGGSGTPNISRRRRWRSSANASAPSMASAWTTSESRKRPSAFQRSASSRTPPPQVTGEEGDVVGDTRRARRDEVGQTEALARRLAREGEALDHLVPGPVEEDRVALRLGRLSSLLAPVHRPATAPRSAGSR